MKIFVLVMLVSFLCNAGAFGMTNTEEDPVVRFHGCDDETTEAEKIKDNVKEIKELVFTETEVAQNEIKDVIKLTVSVRGNDETSVIRAQYILPKGQKHSSWLLPEAFWIQERYVSSNVDGVINLDALNIYEAGSLHHKPLPDFARDAKYVATGYLYLRADYENVENRWFEALQDQKLSKFKNVIKELTERVQDQRSQAKRMESIKNETLVDEEDNEDFRQEMEDARRQLAGLDPCDGLEFVDSGYVSDDPEEEDGSSSE